MTLHISFVCDGFVLQVGDRLVTRRQTDGAVEPFDPFANKMIVLAAKQSFLTVSYAGLAFVDGVPTDEWLMRAITSDALPATSGATPGARLPTQFGAPFELNPRLVQDRVVGAIADRLWRQTRWHRYQRTLEIAFTGWTWPRNAFRRQSARPTTYSRFLTTHDGGREVKIIGESRGRPFQHQTTSGTIFAIGSPRSALLEDLAVRIRKAMSPGRPLTPDEIEATIVEMFREESASDNSTIGSDLVSCFMTPVGENPRVRYFRDMDLQQSRPAFAPAVITASGMIQPASQFTGPGGFSVFDKGTEIKFECVPDFPSGSSHRVFRSQSRKPLED